MREKIPILYVIQMMKGFAGTEKHLYEIVKRLNKDRFKPIICCFEIGKGKMLREFKDIDIELIVLPIKKIYGFNALRYGLWLHKFIKQRKIKIVQTFHVKADLYIPLIAKLSGVPIVLSSRRDLGFNQKKQHIIAQRFLNVFVNKIIVDSEAVGKVVMKKENVDRTKIKNIYNGVNLEFFNQNETSREIREKFGIAPSELVVGSIANFNPIKGWDFFIQACRLILQKHDNVKFLFVGGGPLLKEYQDMVERLGISQKVIFTGNIKNVNEVFPIIDVSVNSSLSEGFSNTILESMATGKPVVATNVGGNPEAVIEGETGFLVQPKDPEALAEAVIKLLEDKQLARGMGIAGRERVIEHFTLDRMIRETESLYDSLLEKKMIRREGDVQKERRDVRLFFSKAIKLLLSAILYYSGLFMVMRKVLRLLPYQRGIKILAYHRVNDIGPDYLFLNTSVANFESQLRYLKRHFKIISLEEAVQLLRSNEPISEDLFVITFDDGYKDNYINAFPILKGYKTPATIFLTVQPIEDRIPLWFEDITSIIEITSQEFLNLESFGLGKYPLSTPAKKKKALNDIMGYAKRMSPPEQQKLVDFLSEELKVDPQSLKFNDQMLSWKEIGEMRRYGVSFGSHTISHSILTRLPLENAKYEIERSKELLEEKLREKVSFFAYPNGLKNDFNGEIIQILKDSGFSAAFTLMNGFNDGNTDLFALRRICMTEGISVGLNGEFSAPYFALKMAGIFDIFPFRFLKKKFAESAAS